MKTLDLAKALWRLDCINKDEDDVREGRKPPDEWANPWHENGCGISQQILYLRQALLLKRLLCA